MRHGIPRENWQSSPDRQHWEIWPKPTQHKTPNCRQIDHKTKSGEDSDLPETQWDDCFENQIGKLNMSGIKIHYSLIFENQVVTPPYASIKLKVQSHLFSIWHTNTSWKSAESSCPKRIKRDALYTCLFFNWKVVHNSHLPKPHQDECSMIA